MTLTADTHDVVELWYNNFTYHRHELRLRLEFELVVEKMFDIPSDLHLSTAYFTAISKYREIYKLIVVASVIHQRQYTMDFYPFHVKWRNTM